MTEAHASPSSESLDNYQLRLPGYEGPLDVLLRLIERNQLEITDVSLVTVTSQFMEYVASLTEAPDQVIAAFATVGTRLAVLKSRSLLPRPDAVTDDDGPSDLTRQLLEYRKARAASAFLGQRASHDFRSYGRGSLGMIDPELKRSAERLGQYAPALLVQSLRRRLTVVPRPARMIPRRKLVSLRQTVGRILDLTQLGGRIRFSKIVESYVSRTEVATAFLGMLVLVRRDVIEVGQSEMFGDIDIQRNAGTDVPMDIKERFDGD